MKKRKPFSVLLLYPDYIASEFGHETFYGWTRARDVTKAIRNVQLQAQRMNPVYEDCGKDFHALLVVRGHIKGLPT